MDLQVCNHLTFDCIRNYFSGEVLLLTLCETLYLTPLNIYRGLPLPGVRSLSLNLVKTPFLYCEINYSVGLGETHTCGSGDLPWLLKWPIGEKDFKGGCTYCTGTAYSGLNWLKSAHAFAEGMSNFV